MNGTKRSAGRKPVRIRPEVPRADYTDDISDKAFEKLRESVADLNDPKHKRRVVSSIGWPSDE